jgi:RNA polymerase sigma-70 factor (sigma-E family)
LAEVETPQAESFDDFVHRRSPALLRFAKMITGNDHDAADAVQEALMAVYSRWQRLSPDGNPEAYAKRCIVNTHRMRLRKYRRETIGDVPEQSRADSYAVESDNLMASDVFGALSTRQRAAVVLRFNEDLAFAQIAEVLGCTEATARSLVHRALEQLRKEVRRG